MTTLTLPRRTVLGVCLLLALATLLGGSGTGKSVLLKHIVRLLEPDRGQIWVDGQEMAAEATISGLDWYAVVLWRNR